MYILAFETSCDDTSIAIFKDDILIAMDTASQIKIHALTGWVVPEVAAREHANAIFDVLQNVLEQAGFNNSLQITHSTLREGIDHIAVTATPWLMPSLLTWLSVARTLGNIHNIPVHEINHIQAHIFANFLERKKSDIQFPLVCLTVSWGHNELYHMQDMWDFNRVGGTTDDAAWEAFDKVAKMMWLGYPGWPIISQLADTYAANHPDIKPKHPQEKTLFPRVWLEKKWPDFSFSGLKSAVKREVDTRSYSADGSSASLSESDIQEIAYEFQNAATEVLAYKLVNTAKNYWVKTCLLAGGVSANDHLKKLIQDLAQQAGITFTYPTKKVFCMDNAAMVGMIAYYKITEAK